MKKALSIILCLAMLVSVIPVNVFAAPTAVAGGDTAYEATEEQGTLSADTCTVTFNAGTSADVTGMPENTQVDKNATYIIPETLPQREGYLFDGWVTSLGSDETVTSYRIAQDTTFYAKWTKGGYMVDFTNPGDTVASTNGNVINLADGGRMEVSQGNKETTAINHETGELYMDIQVPSGRNMDFYFVLTPPSDLFIHTSDIKEIIVAARSNAPVGNRISKIYYTTKNENNVSNGGMNERQTITNIPLEVTGNIADKVITHFPASKVTEPADWKDYIGNIRVNYFGTDAACSTSSIYLDYIKVPGIPTVEAFDLTVANPVASAAKFGADAFTANGDFVVKSVEWVGGEFVADNYFDGNTAYTVAVEVEAAEGKVLSDAPAAAVVNGMPATVVSDGETATITYTFPATDALIPIQVRVSTKDNAPAVIDEAWGTLQLTSAIRAQGGLVPETGVIWSIPEAYAKIATVDQNGLVSAIYNCEALPVVATSKYDHKTQGTINIAITNQSDPVNVTFDGAVGEGETVRYLPENLQTKGFYTLPADTATTTRASYALRGWAKTPGGEIIKEDFITADTTYYAVWGYTKIDNMNSASGTAFTAANSDGTFTATYKTIAANNKVEPFTPALNYTIVTPTNTDVTKGVVFYANRAGKKTLFSNANRILLDSFDCIEMRSTLAPTDMELTVGVATSDEDGNNATELETVVYAGEELSAIVDFDGEWYSYKISTAVFSNWENYLEEIKLTFVKKDAEGNAVAMDVFNADFIRLVGRDIPAIGLEMAAPVAATENTNDVTPCSNEFEVAGVEWTPELLDGKYFAGDTAYTAKVTVDVKPGYFMFPRSPYSVTVNGVEVEYERINNNKSAVLTYTFEKTEDIDFTLVDVTYHEKNDDDVVASTEKVIAGNSVDVTDKVPENIPTNYRWIGWSLTDGGELITSDVEIAANTDFYAIYEFIDGFDFSDDKDISDEITCENGDVEFDGKWAVVTPDGDAALKLGGFNLSADDYDYLEIVFDANRAERTEINKFDENLVPDVVISGLFGEYTPELESSEALIVNNTLSRKYIYNLTGDNRTSEMTAVSISPYSGTPVWAVASVKFVKNASLTDDIAISDLETPKTWNTPDDKATVNGSYAIKSVEWTSESGFTTDGSFASDAVYTVNVVVDTVPGYRIDTETVTVNGEAPDTVVRNEDGTLTVTVTYPATDALVDFELTVADASISVAEGKVQLVPTFSANVPVKDIVWVITDNGEGGNSAVIDGKGVVKASYDGVITVKATSVYDPSKTAVATVTITNQIPYYTIHFDANTTGEVSGMPEDVQVKYDYVLPNTPPVRDGFVFAGWIEKPGDTLTVTKTFVNANKTYYALWVSGLSVDFYNEDIDSLVWKPNANAQSPTYNEEEGTFTFVPANPIIWINTNDKDPLFVGKNNTVVEVRLKISKAGQYQICCWFESDDMEGNVLGPAYTGPNDRFVNNAYKYIKYDFAADTYKTIQFDFSGTADWVDGQPTAIRIDFPSGYTDADTLVTVDYVRAVSVETSEVEVTGVDAPVAKAIADTDAVAKDASKYTVTNVTWKEELLHDVYFDANKSYTVQVTVKGATGYVMSDSPTKATINGKPATISAYDATTGELTIEYTFPATANADTSEYNTVTLSSKNVDGEPVETERVVFVGDAFSIDAISVADAPSSTRFIGWADSADAVLPNVSGSFEVTEDVTYYAVYEEITEFDYSNPYHRPGTEARLGSSLSFDGTYAVIKPAHVEAASALATPVMNLDGTKFGKVELYFSATMNSTIGVNTYDNKFSAYLEPELKYSTMEAPNAYENVATLVGAERVVIDNRPMYKYTYDMTTNSAWHGPIASIYTNPYGNIVFQSSVKKILYPEWGLAYIKFIENVEAPVAEFEITAPETWQAPATVSDVVTSDAFVVTDLTWNPSVEDVFTAVGTYTANITYRAAAGYKVTEAVATINGEETVVVDNGDGTFTTSYTFPQTENLKEVEVVISGPSEIKDPGRYIQLTGKTVAVDGSYIPVADVVWSIEDGETYATLSENGRVYPLSNGTVTVKATSVYDEYVSATYEVEISNQKDLYTVTFDKNTQANVTGVPSPVSVSGNFVPEANNMKRDDGFFFLGWALDEDATEPSESFVITSDVTLYAKWSAGYEWSFDNAATALNPYTPYKQVSFENGIGIYSPVPGQSTHDVVATSSGLTQLKIETAKHQTLAIRYSQGGTASCIFYLQSGDDLGNKSPWNESAKVYQHGISANAPGTYNIVTFDLSSHGVWTQYPYVEQVRYDNQAGYTLPVYIDWVRLYNNERTVEFNANGGLLSLYGGEVNSYKELYNNGDVINLPATPTRDGYEFLGWAKATADYNKLYNGKFTVTDNVTLYAIWAPVVSGETVVSPDEEVTVTVDIADEMVVGENQTVVVKITGDVNATGDEGVVLHFTDANGAPQTVVVSETLEDTIVFDLSGEGFEGTVTDVYLTLPTGTTDGVTVDKVGFTTTENANALAGIVDNSDKPINPDVTTKPGGSAPEHPGHNSYPEYQEGQIIGGPSMNPSSDDSKTGTTPERPKDEDIVMGGGKSDPGNEKFPFVDAYDNRFVDVTYSHWFFDDVVNSFELGFMNGVSDEKFDPNGTVTVAQAIAVAARIHSTYNKALINPHVEGDAWYERYVKYAKSKYIILDGQFTDFNAPITREQVAALFVKVAPASWFTKINDFTEIPDMGTNASVLRLYNAGIMIGVDDEYNFNGKANITRAEFSAVINRIALINSRIKVEFPVVEETPVETPVETPEVVEA